MHNNMLILLIIFYIFITLLPHQVFAQAQLTETDEIIEDILRQNNSTSKISIITHSIKIGTHSDITQIFPEYDPENIINNLVKGNANINAHSLINRIVIYILNEAYKNTSIIIKIFIITALCSVLQSMQTSFFKKSVGELAFYTCYIVLISLLLVTYKYAAATVSGVIDSMVAFMHSTIPSLILLLSGSGNIVSAGILKPITVAATEIGATSLKNTVVPLIYFTFVASIVSNISENIHINRVHSFLKQLCNWAIGGIITVFVAIISLQGALGATVDGVSSKTTKFAIGAFIPVVGKYLADAADTIIGCTLLIKNAAGIAAMLGVIAICIIPILKIIALITVYRIGEILIEPISDRRIVQCVTQMGSSLTSMCGVVAAVAFMFMVSLTAIITAGNISMMIR